LITSSSRLSGVSAAWLAAFIKLPAANNEDDPRIYQYGLQLRISSSRTRVSLVAITASLLMLWTLSWIAMWRRQELLCRQICQAGGHSFFTTTIDRWREADSIYQGVTSTFPIVSDVQVTDLVVDGNKSAQLIRAIGVLSASAEIVRIRNASVITNSDLSVFYRTHCTE
jgi:hypothetical protein